MNKLVALFMAWVLICGFVQIEATDVTGNSLIEVPRLGRVFTQEDNEKIKEAKAVLKQLKQSGLEIPAKEIEEKISIAEKLLKIAKYEYVSFGEEEITVFLKKRVKDFESGDLEKGINSYSSFDHSFGTGTISFDYKVEEKEKKREIETVFESAYVNNDPNGNAEHYIFTWTETPVEQYQLLPPKNIVNELNKHKDRGIFDYFTIATVEAKKEVKDPLLLGRIEGSSKRFFIAEWGEDIKIEEII